MQRRTPPTARFGVVVCPSCRHAKGVDLHTQTTTCGRCGKRHKTHELRVFFQTDDAQRLRDAIGVLEAKVKGKETGLIEVQALEEELEARRARGGVGSPARREGADLIALAASRAASERAAGKKADAILDALDAHGPEDGFTEEMVEAAFVAAGLPKERAEKEIRRCLVQDTLFEPRVGRLKRL